MDTYQRYTLPAERDQARARLAARLATVDEIITMVTQAATTEDATAVVALVPALKVCAVADQLYIDADFRGIKWLRAAVVREARA